MGGWNTAVWAFRSNPERLFIQLRLFGTVVVVPGLANPCYTAEALDMRGLFYRLVLCDHHRAAIHFNPRSFVFLGGRRFSNFLSRASGICTN